MKRSRNDKSRRDATRRTARNTDVVSVHHVDWESPAAFDVDPALAEAIRTRSALKQTTLRVGTDQIAEARRVAAQTGIPYQRVLRRWLAEGASLSRSLRKAG